MAAAWQYALEDEDSAHAYSLATLKDVDWTGRLGVARAKEFIERTLALPALEQHPWLLARHALAHCLLREADRQGAMSLMDSTAEALEDAPEDLLLEALMSQAHIGLYDAPQEKTLALLDRCLALAHDPYARAEALRMKGSLICWTPDYEQARALFAEAATLYPPQDPAHRRMLIDQGFLARRKGQFEEALQCYRLCVEQAKKADDRVVYRNARGNMVDALVCLGRWQEAIEIGRECLKIEEAHGDRYSLLGLLWNLSRPFLEVGELELSARLMSASAALWAREIRPLSADELEEMEEVRTGLSQNLDKSRLDYLWAEGERLTLQEALALVKKSSF